MNDGVIISAVLGFSGMIITALIKLVPSRGGGEEMKVLSQIVLVLTNMSEQLTQLMTIVNKQKEEQGEIKNDVHELHAGYAPEGHEKRVLTLEQMNEKLDKLLLR